MNSPQQAGARMTYLNSMDALIDGYVREGGYSQAAVEKAVKEAVLSQSYLRLEQQIVSTTSTYTFPVLLNENNSGGSSTRPTEQRLNMQDAFYATGMEMYISKVATTSSTVMQLDTYPNPTVYPANGALGSTGNTLLNLYNGKMTVGINNRTIIPAFDLMRFMQIPQTQQTGAYATTPLTQFDGTAVDFVEPNVVFIGSKKNVIQINMPGAISTLEATPVYIVLLFRGILAQNVTIVS
jgi:hypothetical protein